MAVVSGDSIAGEANIGTLRNLLVVPVSRTRLLAVAVRALGSRIVANVTAGSTPARPMA